MADDLPTLTKRAPGRITVVRHGATSWSRSGRHTGRTDLPLDAEGETDARAIPGRLAALDPPATPALVLTSPLRRAADTCRLAGFATPVLAEELLEWDYGDYEGRTTAEIQAERPGWDLFHDGCPGGEAIADVAGRVDRLLERLAADPSLAGEEVLMFAHGHLLRVLCARWLHLGGREARHFVLGVGRLGRLSSEYSWPAIVSWNT